MDSDDLLQETTESPLSSLRHHGIEEIHRSSEQKEMFQMEMGLFVLGLFPFNNIP